jgi:ubiquinone/menaquinone biosynthesis C-methylase UbiE
MEPGMDIDEAKYIYSQQAEQYERLICYEDCLQNIPRALKRIAPFNGLDVVELGAGTGRLTRLLAPVTNSIHAFDISVPMLNVAVDRLRNAGFLGWDVALADHRSLPLKDKVADVAISGWSICYLVTWSRNTWRSEVDRALAEMERVLRPGGKIILLETLGTGYQTPCPPEHLAGYYDYLAACGFASTWIRTDYQFASLAEAEALIRFFFGDEMAQKVVEENKTRVPECTGIWWWERDSGEGK